MECLTGSSIKIISLTITQGSYNTDSKSDTFDLKNPKIIHDLQHPKQSQTILGLLAIAMEDPSQKGTRTIHYTLL
ncbi:MAG: hypothetical protein ABI045_03935 [Flavobacteriales bacterium]